MSALSDRCTWNSLLTFVTCLDIFLLLFLTLVKSNLPSFKKCVLSISQVPSQTLLCSPRTTKCSPVSSPNSYIRVCEHGNGSQSVLPRAAAAAPGNKVEMQILKMPCSKPTEPETAGWAAEIWIVRRLPGDSDAPKMCEPRECHVK